MPSASAKRARYTSTMTPEEIVLVPVSLDSSPTIEAYKKDVDRTLLRENLKLSTSETWRR